MRRVDTFPTHEYQGLKLRTGRPYPFGATIYGNAVNFSVYSRYATSCTLVLFHNHEEQPFIEIPFFKEFRLGNVFSIFRPTWTMRAWRPISHMVIRGKSKLLFILLKILKESSIIRQLI